jgi:hypothetical protein
VAPPARVIAHPGQSADSTIRVELRSGYHCNSNTPSEDYLIPLRLTWAPGVLQAESIVYPKPKMEKYQFSAKPLSVFTGDFDIVTKFKVAANAAPGQATLSGKLRYQACTNTLCLPPRSISITLPVEVVK